jgi:hypothetical protein
MAIAAPMTVSQLELLPEPLDGSRCTIRSATLPYR